MNSENALYISVGCGIVGTFLFFYGLAGFMVLISENNTNRYLRGLNIFVTKQMNNKINTTFISMSLISLMLFVTISALSTGVSMNRATLNSVQKNTPFTVSTEVYLDSNQTKEQALENLNNNVYKEYSKDLNTSILEVKYLKNKVILKNDKGQEFAPKYGTSVMSISSYNAYLNSLGKQKIDLGNDEVLITTNNSSNIKEINNILKDTSNIKYKGKSYKVVNNKAIEAGFMNSQVPSNFYTIIVPDKSVFMDSNNKDSNNIIINSMAITGLDTKSMQKAIDNNYKAYNEKSVGDKNVPFLLVSTKQSVIEESQGISTMILYIAIYIGVVFLLTSSAIIALQQLVEATDSKERYDILRKIGATNSMINKAILKQVSIAFILPLTVAVVDSIIAIKAVSSFVETFGKGSIVGSSIITGAVIVIIYGGYMLATFLGFKNAVKEVN